MYSVLILNQKTMEVFQDFYPLFIETMNAGAMGICRWQESGDTLETALPDLKDLVEDKEEWRAVIVRMEDEEPMSEFVSRPSNPFDFLYYREEKRPYQESPVPLVRLTNILQGPTAPEVSYTPELVHEYNKAPRLVYHPVRSEEAQNLFAELTEKYAYSAPSPQEMILVSTRMKQPDKDNLEQAWGSYNEMDSSNFWKINQYGDRGRFIIYDMEDKGSVRKEADLFKFWTQILLLIRNDIEPDMLQAYRLYRMNLHIDRRLLALHLQENVSRLNGASYFLDRLVETEEKKLMARRQEMPDYRIDVPVSIDFPSRQELEGGELFFPPVSNSIDRDLGKWAAARRESEAKLRLAVEKAEIAMDESAENARSICEMYDSEVHPLGRFQEKRIRADLKDLYRTIICMQKDLPGSDEDSDKAEEKAAADVRKRLLDRLTGGQILGIAMIVIFLAGLAALSAFIARSHADSGTRRAIFSNVLIMVDIMVLPVLFVIIYQNLDLAQKMQDFRNAIHRSVAKLNDNSNLYSDFLSSIASHSRGMSYLQTAGSGKFLKRSSSAAVDRHRRAIDQMMYHLRKWNKAFYLKVSFDSEVYEDLVFDINSHPMESDIYTLEYGNSYPAALNKSGREIESPFEFVQKMELIREEIYE